MIIELNPEGDLEADFLGGLAERGLSVALTQAQGTVDVKLVDVRHSPSAGLLAIYAQRWLGEEEEPPPTAPVEEFLLDGILKVYVY